MILGARHAKDDKDERAAAQALVAQAAAANRNAERRNNMFMAEATKETVVGPPSLALLSLFLFLYLVEARRCC